MAEVILLALALALAGVVVLAPLLLGADTLAPPDDDPESAAIRHRVALEALRDLDADRRAGLLDEETYAAQLADAEARAAETRSALERRAVTPTRAPGAGARRRAAIGAAAVIGVALIAGVVVPGTGLANGTVVNQALAEARAAEEARQQRIEELQSQLAEDPSNPAALSELADLHLAGSSGSDLARAATALQVLIALEPDRADAYERIIAAYLRAGDHANARAALSAYAERPTADDVEIAFFDGLIALRGEDDPDRAVAAFDRFLELAPDDPRAEMVRTLRAEANAAAD